MIELTRETVKQSAGLQMLRRRIAEENQGLANEYLDMIHQLGGIRDWYREDFRRKSVNVNNIICYVSYKVIYRLKDGKVRVYLSNIILYESYTEFKEKCL